MKIGSVARVCFFTLLLVALFLEGGLAKQRIIKMRGCKAIDRSGRIVNAQSHTLEEPLETLADSIAYSFEVYEAEEIDKKTKDLADRISTLETGVHDVRQSLQVVDQKIKFDDPQTRALADRISTLETGVRDARQSLQVVDQKIKSAEDRISADVKNQIASLRSDLQRQIDELKARR